MKINNVCILGAGTLGTRIALQAALSGFQVAVYDINAEAFVASNKVMAKILRSLTLTDEIIAKINFTTDPAEAVADADIISESVTEELPLKRQVWAQFSALAPSKMIFTTNTSYLLPSMLVDSVDRPALFCAFHFHDVFYSKVVDIMPHPGTSEEVVTLLEVFGRALKQVPVIVRKENPGYVFNYMLMAVIGAAGKLRTKEIASIEDIDKSWMVNFHMPMGPFGILDSIGLDTAWHVTHNLEDAGSQAFAALLKTYIDAGKLGEKTGEGFYTYPAPAYKDPDFLS
ncbi:MAG: 3-hydroxyacyl-CoA dehydrogenase NAD-binding domain-containing protein [Aquirufa sp.]